MKLLLIGSMLFTGGSAAAMQNEEVSETVNQGFQYVQNAVQNRLGRRLAETVTETGFPYPPEQFMDTLTEDQAFQITSEIDLINAEYDWQNMTDEEIQVALEAVHVRLDALYSSLGLELQQAQHQYKGVRGQGGKNVHPERSFDGECPYDDVDDSADDGLDAA